MGTVGIIIIMMSISYEIGRRKGVKQMMEEALEINKKLERKVEKLIIEENLRTKSD